MNLRIDLTSFNTFEGYFSFEFFEKRNFQFTLNQ